METLNFKKNEIQEKYKELFDCSLNIIYVIDLSGNFIDANEIALKTFGYNREEIPNISFKELIDKSYSLNMLNGLQEIKENGKNSKHIEYKINRKDGKFIFLEAYGIPIKKKETICGVLWIANDITAHKIIEKNTKNSEETYKFISENANDMIAILNDKYEYEYINEETSYRFMGYKSDEIIGSSPLKFMHPDDIQIVAKILKEGMIKGEGELQYRYKHKNNKWVWLESKGKTFVDKEGKLKGIIISRDITGRKATEQKLKESEEKYRNILENMKEGYIEVDLQSNFTFVNQTICNLLGYSKDELLNMNFRQIILPNEVEEIYNSLNNLFMQEIPNLSIEFVLINKYGKEYYIESSMYLKYDLKENIIGFYGLFRDITYRKEAERLIKEERTKLEELDVLKRKLTAKLSEELESPISEIFEATKFLLDSYKDKLDKKATDLLELIRRGGEKSRNMVERILDITRMESESFKLNKKKGSIIEILKKALKEVSKYILQREIVLKINSLEDVYAEVDEIRIIQVISYIISNSIKNSPFKGEIVVTLISSENYAELIINSKKFEFSTEALPFEYKYSKEIISLHQGSIIINPKEENNTIDIIIRLPSIAWEKLLIHLYVIYKSGILLFEHPFLYESGDYDSLIVSGGLIGTMNILKEIVKGEKQIRTIDHGDRKIMFEINKTGDVIFALIVKEENFIIRNKLNFMIKDFEHKYEEKIKDIKNSSMHSYYWIKIEDLVKKYFI